MSGRTLNAISREESSVLIVSFSFLFLCLASGYGIVIGWGLGQRSCRFPFTPTSPCGIRMPIRANIGAATIGAMLACLAVLPTDGVRAEGIDTEHVFAFMIGTDTGNVG